MAKRIGTVFWPGPALEYRERISLLFVVFFSTGATRTRAVLYCHVFFQKEYGREKKVAYQGQRYQLHRTYQRKKLELNYKWE